MILRSSVSRGTGPNISLGPESSQNLEPGRLQRSRNESDLGSPEASGCRNVLSSSAAVLTVNHVGSLRSDRLRFVFSCFHVFLAQTLSFQQQLWFGGPESNGDDRRGLRSFRALTSAQRTLKVLGGNIPAALTSERPKDPNTKESLPSGRRSTNVPQSQGGSSCTSKPSIITGTGSFCCSGEHRRVLARRQAGKTSAMISENLLPVSPGTVQGRPESVVLQRETLFTRGKQFRQLVHPEGQTAQ